MLNHQRQLRINKRDIFLLLPVFITFLLSIALSLAPVVRYRSWSADLRWTHWIGFFLWFSAYAFLYKTIHDSFEKPRFLIFASVQLIVGIGLIMIWRLNYFFGFKQSLWVVFCTLITVLLIKKNNVFEKIRQYKYLLLIVGLVLILLTFFFGTYPGGNGPKLWLGMRGIYFQPSELLKLFLIFYLAAFFSEAPTGKSGILRNIFPTIILVFASSTLLIFQRDLGTTLIFISIYILMVFAVYGKRRILLVSFILLLIATLIGYSMIDLVRIRFEAWIFPWYDPQTASYQIIQAIIAIAAGGILGTGIGLGYPNLIPLSHSDFIFSAIAEEFGLLGSIGLLCLFAFLLFRGLKISLQTKDRFQRYLAIGVTGYLMVQTILIIGGNIRLLPITGVTLPFISYGGSSLLVSYIGLAILISIENNADAQQKVDHKPYRLLAAFFSICLIAIAATLGWWGIIHSHDIQLRDDNARNLIANLFVKRGEIYDRDNQLLAQSIGSPGYLERVYTYPSLSNTIGFFHQKYGLSGIEDAFDAYLRGQKGYPSQDIWYSYLLYDQPPEGRPIRLTIDTSLQQKADDLLQGQKGGLVVLNAANGEIISISTAPYFNANQLDENWVAWENDDSAPLINRVTQGAYPIGGLISPLLLAYDDRVASYQGYTGMTIPYDTIDQACKQRDFVNEDEDNLLQNGCVGTALSIVENNSPYSYFSQVPLSTIFDPAEIGLAMSMPPGPSPDSKWTELFFGKNMLRSNPLQIARAFLPLSNKGYLVTPSIVSAVNTANAGWVVISNPAFRQVFSEEKADQISTLLTKGDEGYWEITAATKDVSNTYFWYAAGTSEQQGETNYIVTLVLEGTSRETAVQIGQKLLEYLK